MIEMTYKTEYCRELGKPWREATLQEFLYDCPKAFQHCSSCEHCEIRTSKGTTNVIPKTEAF